MAFGKLYYNPIASRCTAIEAIAKINNINLEIVPVDAIGQNASPEYLKINPLGKVPTFIGSDGFYSNESLATAIYLSSQNEKTTLLGKTKQDYASILRWMAFVNGDVAHPLEEWASYALGFVPYNKSAQESAQRNFNRRIAVLEDHLTHNTYLVGERQTVADIYCATIMTRGFRSLFLDSKWREAHPAVTRWFLTIRNHPALIAVAGQPELIETAIAAMPANKEVRRSEKPKSSATPAGHQSAKPAVSKAKAAEADDDEEDKPAPKPKHPLEELGRPTFVLDDWKRKYSNEDTREVALPWFWKNMNFDEYSIWRVDYKYNDELTLVFMSSNLIGGLFNRLEASRKYLFGCLSVFGENNNSIVRGAFLVRGQESLPAFDVAPDYESYEFKKLDPKAAQDRQFLDDMWSWDKPTTDQGKTFQWADGKVFK